jgi:hypothetical protein
MSRLMYACRFDLPSGADADDAYARYRTWIEEHYRRRFRSTHSDFALVASDGSTIALPEGHSLERDEPVTPSGTVRRFTWSVPSDNDASLVWRNRVRIGRFADNGAIEHTIWIDSEDFRISPVRLAMGSPRVVREICAERAVRIGEMELRATPYNLTSEGLVDFLVLLQSPLRRVPIVLLSPYANGTPTFIDANALADHLAGVGVVVRAGSAEVTWDFGDEVGRSLNCFDGGARIYWPGFSLDDDPIRHPLFLGSRIAGNGSRSVSRAIERTIFSVACFRFVPDPRIDLVVTEFDANQRAQRLAEVRTDRGLDWEAYALELDQELARARDRVAELQAENVNLKANQQVFFSSLHEGAEEDDVAADKPARRPTTITEAVAFARQDFSDLTILDSAFESADDCPFRRPQEIYEALSDLNSVAGADGDLRQNLVQRGWGKRCSMFISDTTRNRHGSHYTFEYNGGSTMFEPHVTLGSGDANTCASIHFIADPTKNKIVVAHVGRHLPNTKT